MLRNLLIILLLAISSCAADKSTNACAKIDGVGATSQWVHVDASGDLVYKNLPKGDRIIDFSSAGYMGGGVALPSLPVKSTVKPSGGDDTSFIQDAINAVSSLPLAAGFRGAVLLSPGAYKVSAPLEINASGVVLRGSGSGAGGTTITMTGKPHTFVEIRGEGKAEQIGNAAQITDSYLPAGTASLHVNDKSGFHVGDMVIVERPTTAAWVHFMGMDTLVRDGKRQTWVHEGSSFRTERTIQAISGNTITLDVPLTDSMDAQLLAPPGCSIYKYDFPKRITQVGVENLRVLSVPQSQALGQPANHLLRMQAVLNGWVRDIVAEETVDSLAIGSGTKQITVERVSIRHSATTQGHAHPADFSVTGTQVLFDQCSSTGDDLFYFVTGAQAQGPNVVLDCNFTGSGSREVAAIAPHQRWATGLLIDRCSLPRGGIDFVNRGNAGSGHGWSIGWGVVWNSVADTLAIQQPPGAQNWAIGSKGKPTKAEARGSDAPLADGIFDSSGKPVAPSSLYLSQLCHRLGPQAVANIGH
ncbi:MAG TPA: hypothetical protein VFB76_07115 [Candidatus Angelobacter sp.]|nr:hypothetical protein [Candidatus Angelobacter sp.]